MVTKPKYYNQESGQVLWELLIVLSISSFLSVSGFHLLNKLLLTGQHHLKQGSECTHYQSLFDALQNSFDHRYTNPFAKDPWLILDVESGNEWYRLKQLEIIKIEKGEIVRWNWEGPSSAKVHINKASKAYYPGDLPSGLIIKFPESTLSFFRDGIAIAGI